MKYNAVWDKLFGLNLFPAETLRSEFQSYSSHTNRYGLPLDNRADYTKSDWLVWCASYAESPEEFAAFIAPLWQAYHESESRVPLFRYRVPTRSQDNYACFIKSSILKCPKVPSHRLRFLCGTPHPLFFE